MLRKLNAIALSHTGAQVFGTSQVSDDALGLRGPHLRMAHRRGVLHPQKTQELKLHVMVALAHPADRVHEFDHALDPKKSLHHQKSQGSIA